MNLFIKSWAGKFLYPTTQKGSGVYCFQVRSVILFFAVANAIQCPLAKPEHL